MFTKLTTSIINSGAGILVPVLAYCFIRLLKFSS